MATVTQQVTPNIPTTVTGEVNVSSTEGVDAKESEKKKHKGPPGKSEFPGLEYGGEGEDKRVKKLKEIPVLFSKDSPDGFNPDKHKLLTPKHFTEVYLVEHHKASVYRYKADQCDEEAKALRSGKGGNKAQKAITNALDKIKEARGGMSAEEFKKAHPDIAAVLEGLMG